MRPSIYKTEAQAILAAKKECLESFEFNVDQTTKDQWLITNESCQCDCGQTPAVHVTFFDSEDNQHYAMAGYCDMCGED